uniref:Uncharacterized protein n=1 Tax=Chromera velia CCMP2878 TaxID=1169474 RepID=A0A0G4HEH4_9ALVE|eukprot:Cvel_26613.t1-p1 / transcript=Cvel_26613.t1 / gene=Cvel_26613 / organism=Chromera_velia_CCMP2878 / gene_product=hypothetical protein / transcript_product=hypothetical protein / location=Cvel_scaffold3193:5428-16039(-) / protein_length=971 / sequence_SO=supercontig / SO=protein_coding / is_pseudo=false
MSRQPAVRGSKRQPMGGGGGSGDSYYASHRSRETEASGGRGDSASLASQQSWESYLKYEVMSEREHEFDGSSKVYKVTLSVSGKRFTDDSLMRLVDWMEDMVAQRKSTTEKFLMHVHIDDNRLTSVGFGRLMGWIKSVSKKLILKHLRAYKNEICDQGVMALGDLIMKQNSPVEEIHLSHNRVTPKGARALWDAILTSRDEDGHSVYPKRVNGQNSYRTVPVWLRMEYNSIPDPRSLVESVPNWKSVFCFAERNHARQAGHNCAPFRCNRKSNDAVIHLFSFNQQDRQYGAREVGANVATGASTAAADAGAGRAAAALAGGGGGNEIGTAGQITRAPGGQPAQTTSLWAPVAASGPQIGARVVETQQAKGAAAGGGGGGAPAAATGAGGKQVGNAVSGSTTWDFRTGGRPPNQAATQHQQQNGASGSRSGVSPSPSPAPVLVDAEVEGQGEEDDLDRRVQKGFNGFDLRRFAEKLQQAKEERLRKKKRGGPTGHIGQAPVFPFYVFLDQSALNDMRELRKGKRLQPLSFPGLLALDAEGLVFKAHQEEDDTNRVTFVIMAHDKQEMIERAAKSQMKPKVEELFGAHGLIGELEKNNLIEHNEANTKVLFLTDEECQMAKGSRFNLSTSVVRSVDYAFAWAGESGMMMPQDCDRQFHCLFLSSNRLVPQFIQYVRNKRAQEALASRGGEGDESQFLKAAELDVFNSKVSALYPDLEAACASPQDADAVPLEEGEDGPRHCPLTDPLRATAKKMKNLGGGGGALGEYEWLMQKKEDECDCLDARVMSHILYVLEKAAEMQHGHFVEEDTGMYSGSKTLTGTATAGAVVGQGVQMHSVVSKADISTRFPSVTVTESLQAPPVVAKGELQHGDRHFVYNTGAGGASGRTAAEALLQNEPSGSAHPSGVPRPDINGVAPGAGGDKADAHALKIELFHATNLVREMMARLEIESGDFAGLDLRNRAYSAVEKWRQLL